MEKIKAAIYCRLANDNPMIMNNQRKKLRIYATENGHDLVAEYYDSGFSGRTLDRPAFLQMDADITAGKIDTVFVSGISRIGRDFIKVGNWLSDLDKRGAKLIAIDGSHEMPSFINDFYGVFRKSRKRKRA